MQTTKKVNQFLFLLYYIKIQYYQQRATQRLLHGYYVYGLVWVPRDDVTSLGTKFGYDMLSGRVMGLLPVWLLCRLIDWLSRPKGLNLKKLFNTLILTIFNMAAKF